MSDQSSSQAYKRDQVVEIINSVVTKVESAEHLSKECIFKELKNLQNVINEARNDLGFSGSQINQDHIPTATDELDAIVEATAGATGSIMDACETIEEHCSKGETAPSADVAAEVTKIYEACSFQDITGQRVTKVVQTLKQIEEKVELLVGTLASAMPASGAQEEKADPNDENSLLNGPQAADKAISQDEIDALLDDLF